MARSKVVAVARIWEHRRPLILIFSLIAPLIVVLALWMRPHYQSTSRLVYAEYESHSARGAGDAGAVLIEIMRSRTLRDHIVARFGLNRDYAADSSAARDKLARNTSFAEDERAQTITVIVTDRHPQRAMEICDAYSEELNFILTGFAISTARQQRIFLSGRLRAANQVLNLSQRALAAFSSQHSITDIEDQENTLFNSVSLLEEKVITEKVERSALRESYTDNNLQMREVSGRIAGFQLGLAGINRRNESDPLPGPSIQEIPLLQLPYSELVRRNAFSEKSVYDLSQILEMTKIEEAGDTHGVAVLDKASLPETAVYSSNVETLIAGAILMELCAMTWVMGLVRNVNVLRLRKMGASHRLKTPCPPAVKLPPNCGDRTSVECSIYTRRCNLLRYFQRNEPNS